MIKTKSHPVTNKNNNNPPESIIEPKVTEPILRPVLIGNPPTKIAKYVTHHDLETLDKFLDLYNYEVVNLNVNKIAYNNLKEPLTILNNMIGMKKLKQEVLIMTLHYLRHVPEEFTQIMEERYETLQNTDLAYNADDDFYTIFNENAMDVDDDDDDDDIDIESSEENECINCLICQAQQTYETVLNEEASKSLDVQPMDDDDDEKSQLYKDARKLALTILVKNLHNKNTLVDEKKDVDPDSNKSSPIKTRIITRSQKRKQNESIIPQQLSKGDTDKKSQNKKRSLDNNEVKTERLKKQKDEENARKIIEDIAAKEAAKKEQAARKEARKLARAEKLDNAKFKQALENEIIKNTVNNLDMMHTIISGSPGTGKSHVAQYIGAIYAAFGFLKPGKFNKISTADLIAPYVGQTTDKTRKICQKSLGGALFLDEAYALGSAGGRGDSDFGREAVDTITDYLTEHKHDFVMIVAGYENELETRFFSLNTGLRRRFQWKFTIENYTPAELQQIFAKMAKDSNYEFAEPLPISWFANHYSSFPNFGGSMESLLAKVKYANTKRTILLDNTHKNKLTMQDMDAGFQTYIEHTVEAKKNLSHTMMYI
jgi:hypothetical protein